MAPERNDENRTLLNQWPHPQIDYNCLAETKSLGQSVATVGYDLTIAYGGRVRDRGGGMISHDEDTEEGPKFSVAMHHRMTRALLDDK
jgi:hypothetical protein